MNKKELEERLVVLEQALQLYQKTTANRFSDDEEGLTRVEILANKVDAKVDALDIRLGLLEEREMF